MIYEIRTYEAMPGKIQALNQRFANITMKYFEKHGLKAVGFWTEDVGTSNTLVYMLAFDDMAQRERAWSAFRADGERLELFAETESQGQLVARITNRILKPTDYSPLQ
ncbi:MAG: NIPSNAP family protein [Chloroflexi bacterium]|nr:NIPSNAP family protein [Chloroflexota bacterium]